MVSPVSMRAAASSSPQQSSPVPVVAGLLSASPSPKHPSSSSSADGVGTTTRSLQQDFLLFLVLLGVSFVALVGMVEFDSHVQKFNTNSPSSSSSHHQQRGGSYSSSSAADQNSEAADDPSRVHHDWSSHHQQGHDGKGRHRNHPHQFSNKKRNSQSMMKNNNNTKNGTSNEDSNVEKVFHPTFPLFVQEWSPIENKQFEGQHSRRVTNWERAHPVPKMKNCSRAVLQDIRPVFFNPRPEIAILTMHSVNVSDNMGRRAKIQRATLLPLMYYCKANRYDLIVEDHDVVDPRRPPAWSKIRGLRKWINMYKWIIWIDMDVIMTNFNVTFEWFIQHRENIVDRENAKAFADAQDIWRRTSKNKKPFYPPAPRPKPQIIIGNDWNGINSGITMWRNSTFTQGFLKRMWGVPQELAHPFWDQGSMRYLLTRDFRGRDRNAADYDRARLDITDEVNRYPEALLLWGRQIQQIKWKDGNWLIHFASCKFFPACTKWMDYYNNLAGCQFGVPVMTENSTIHRPLYRQDLDVKAPDINEDLEPYPTQLRQYAYHFPKRLVFRQPTVKSPEKAQKKNKDNNNDAHHDMLPPTAPPHHHMPPPPTLSVHEHAEKLHQEALKRVEDEQQGNVLKKFG